MVVVVKISYRSSRPSGIYKLEGSQWKQENQLYFLSTREKGPWFEILTSLRVHGLGSLLQKRVGNKLTSKEIGVNYEHILEIRYNWKRKKIYWTLENFCN